MAFAFSTPLTGSPLEDGYYDMYNLDFAGAHQKFQQWMSAHPEDPMGPASDAAAWLFGEFDRLHIIDVQLFADQSRFDNRQRLTPDPAVRRSFDQRADQADRLADAALQRNSRDAMAFYVKTLICGMKSDYALMIDKRDIAALNLSKQASSYSKQALAIDPESAPAHYALANVLAIQPGRAADAVSHYEAALRLHPEFAEAHANLANVLAHIPGRMSDAIAHYEAALRIDPNLPWVHFNLGLHLAQVPGRSADAIAHYEEAVRLKPDYTDALNGLAILFAQAGHLEEARAQWMKALEIDPNYTTARQNLLLLDRMAAPPR